MVQLYFASIRRVCLSILDDPDEADDAVQDTFIAACRSLGGFRGQAELKTWLTAISINVCRGRLRRRKRRETLHRALLAMQALVRRPAASAESALEHKERQSELWRAVDSLDEKHRLPIVLHYVHEMSVPEIASLLDASPGTIYSRLHYARRQLAARLDGQDR